MKYTLTYSANISWMELVDFLDEKYLDLLCKRLHVDRSNIVNVPFILSERENVLCFFNIVEVIYEK